MLIDVELDQFECAVDGELTDDREPGHEHSGRDEDAIVGASRDERREIVPPRSEHFDDAKELEDLEVVDRRLAVRAALRAELAVEIREERRAGTDRPALAGSRLVAGLGGVDPLLHPLSDSSDELGRDRAQVSHDARLEHGVLLRRGEALQFFGGPDLVAHTSRLSTRRRTE